MSNKINEIKNALRAGARATKYRISFTFPNAIKTQTDLRDISTLAKAASFPNVTIGQIEVFNQGRKIVIPGDTSYDNSWSVTFYNNEEHSIRRDLLLWMKATDNFQANTHSGVPAELMVDMSISQLDSLEKEVVKYTFHNVWVSEVGAVTLDATSIDTLQEFDVTFVLSDWVVNSTDEFSHPDKVFNAPSKNITSKDQ